jgi:hypothetical protein
MKKLILLLILLFASPAFAGTAYYADFTATGSTNVGSFANPFRTWAAINGKVFSTGDDLYFKRGVTFTLASNSDRLQVDWSGTAEDRVIIGCYVAENNFDCGATPLVEGNRPVLSGNNNLYPGEEQGLIDVRNRSYVTIKDLSILNAGLSSIGTGKAIDVRDSNNVNVENCYIYRPRGNCVLYSKVNTGEIIDNYCSEKGYPGFSGYGAAIEITAGNTAGAATNILVARNSVSHSVQEGIGLYKKVTNSIIEHNTVHDIITGFIYIDAAMNNIIRYNLVYETETSVHSRFTQTRSGWAIALNNEEERNYFFMGGNEVYGNLIGGTRSGIVLDCLIKNRLPSSVCYPNDKIYNNVIVDNDTNVIIWGTNSNDGIEFRNNISLQITAGGTHISSSSPAGTTFSHNNWYGNTVPGGNAAINRILGNPNLAKTSGWRDIAPNGLDGTEFLPQLGSPVIDTGQVITGYTTQISAADFKATPISVTTTNLPAGPIWVGAWTTQTGSEDPSTIDATNAYAGGTYTPLLLYLMDDGFGTSLTDHSPNASHATLTNPKWSSMGLTMDTVGQIIAAPIPNFGATFTLFVALTSTQDTANDYGTFWKYGASRVFQVERSAVDTTIRSDIGGSNDSSVYWTGVTDIFDQTFSTKMLTFNDTTNERCLYLNGVVQSCETLSWANPVWSGVLGIGARADGTYPLFATFHAAYAWGGVLTEADALSLHNDYDQMFLSPPVRTFEGVEPPFSQPGLQAPGYVRVIMDGSKPVTKTIGR